MTVHAGRDSAELSFATAPVCGCVDVYVRMCMCVWVCMCICVGLASIMQGERGRWDAEATMGLSKSQQCAIECHTFGQQRNFDFFFNQKSRKNHA